MPDPIRPEDHTIGGRVPARFVAVNGDGLYDSRTAGPQRAAMAEAIHQTFERDARIFNGWQKRVAEWESADPTTERTASGYQVRKLDGRDIRRPFSDPPRQADDPDTEIDRLARLIVDGEYRRRKEVQDA